MAGKIYTKTGDKGQTALFGGKRLPKHHLRIESYGTIDELNCWLGLINDQITDEHINSVLLKIQHDLFVVGSILASGEDPGPYIPEFDKTSTGILEGEIDFMDQSCSPLKNFILPGGHPHISIIHITRCVCRRAERRLTALQENEKVPLELIVFLNRLSDYLFMLARYIAHKMNIPEIPWKPNS